MFNEQFWYHVQWKYAKRIQFYLMDMKINNLQSVRIFEIFENQKNVI